MILGQPCFHRPMHPHVSHTNHLHVHFQFNHPKPLKTQNPCTDTLTRLCVPNRRGYIYPFGTFRYNGQVGHRYVSVRFGTSVQGFGTPGLYRTYRNRYRSVRFGTFCPQNNCRFGTSVHQFWLFLAWSLLKSPQNLALSVRFGTLTKHSKMPRQVL
jgi:hypothetical protein